MKTIFFTLILIMSFNFLNAQKVYTTQRYIADAPNIDGLFDDEIWQEGDWQGDFIQERPNNGAKASQKTVRRRLYLCGNKSL
jgi:hypothetical protein